MYVFGVHFMIQNNGLRTNKDMYVFGGHFMIQNNGALLRN